MHTGSEPVPTRPAAGAPAGRPASAGAAARAPARPAAAGARRLQLLRWLRSAHIYVGLWGALVGLLLGASGLLLNHRAILKLPVERGERAVVQIEFDDVPADAAALARRIGPVLGFDAQRATQAPRIRVEPAATVSWAGVPIAQPERWQVTFALPQRHAQVEYVVGNRFAKVERFDANLLGVLTRLHQSIGVDAAWVLFMDSIAGSFLFLSISGVALWSQLRARRVAGSLLLGGSVAAVAVLVARLAG